MMACSGICSVKLKWDPWIFSHNSEKLFRGYLQIPMIGYNLINWIYNIYFEKPLAVFNTHYKKDCNERNIKISLNQLEIFNDMEKIV